MPAHLLGGDEVGAAPRDRLGLVVVAAGEHAPATVELADAQQAPADVGDASAGGSGRGSNTGPATGSSRAVARSQAADEQPPGEGERGDRAAGIGGEGW